MDPDKFRQNDKTDQKVSSMVALKVCTRGNRLTWMITQCQEGRSMIIPTRQLLEVMDYKIDESIQLSQV